MLHRLIEGFRAMDSHARLFLLIGLTLTLFSAAAVFFFGRYTLWFHLRFSDIMTLILSSVLVTMGGTFLLDVAYKREELPED